MVLLRFDKQEKKWITITQFESIEGDLYLDGKLRRCLDHYKKQQKKDNDVVIIIAGPEGSGKSTILGDILEYMSDGRFNPSKDLVGANYLDGLEKIDNSKKGSYLGFDEGNSFFLATETVKTEHRDLHKIFSIFRQKNLFVGICLPSFFRLGTYFALDRSVALIRTYLTKGGNERGSFAFYGKSLKDRLYRVGKPFYNDNAVKPKFRGKFTKCFKLENEEYKSFKKVTLSSEIQKAKDKCKKPKTEWQIKMDIKKDLVRNMIDKPTEDVAIALELSERQIQRMKKEIKQGIIVPNSPIF